MAFTYLALNLIFIAVTCAVLWRYLPKLTRPWWITLAGMLALTLIFDNVIIASGMVAYDHELLLGLYLGVAPVEDFFYTILALFLVPALWNYFGRTKTTKQVEAA